MDISLPQTGFPMSLKEIRAHIPSEFKRNCMPIVLKLLSKFSGAHFRMTYLTLICYWLAVQFNVAHLLSNCY